MPHFKAFGMIDLQYEIRNCQKMFNSYYDRKGLLKSVHLKKPVVTRFSFLSKNVVIFNITTTNMTTIFERNEDCVTGFLK